MDRLRITVITGVIIMHASTIYVVPVGASYEERTTNAVSIAVITVPMVTALLFGLGPLFLLAGWLSAISIRNHGATKYPRGRLIRLGAPIAIYVLVLGPGADYLGARAMGTAPSWTQFFVKSMREPDLGPVWFLLALLTFSLLYGGFRLLRPAHLSAPRPLRMSVLIAWALGIGAANFLVWLYWGYDRPSLWNATWAHWPQAAGLFLLGVLGRERGWLDPVPRDLSGTCLRLMGAGFLALVAVAAVATASGGDYRELTGGWHWLTGAFAILDGLLGVALSVWVVSVYQRRWNAPLSLFSAGLARWSYAAYLVHQLLLTMLAVSLRFWPSPPEAKFALLVIIGVPLSYLAARQLIRLRYVGRVI
jgi:glucans biosynthesis protein C